MIEQTLKQIEESGIVAVVRAETKETAIAICKACLKGGITAVEVTFTVPDALAVIKALTEQFADTNILIGAGTILDEKTCKAAINAGAKYIVSPGFAEATAAACRNADIPYLPGCLTVTEMMHATAHGAKIIKLFPGSAFGPGYVKAIKGPLPDIKIMPTGGVNLDNIREWFHSGVVAVGIGGELTAPAKTGDYAGVTARAKAFVAAIAEARDKQ